jgi:rubrerythrin
MFALSLGLQAEVVSPGKTLENLQAAHNGESNAKAKYEGYAAKAQTEGYLGAAALFRAAAKAEGIHVNAHATVIKKMGALPAAEIKTPPPGATKANLEDALKGETYEQSTMYPTFIKVAKSEGNKDALQSFTYAITAEGEHARLYADALKNLAATKTAKSFHVCTVCGYTATRVAFANCPSCYNPKDRFVEVL